MFGFMIVCGLLMGLMLTGLVSEVVSIRTLSNFKMSNGQGETYSGNYSLDISIAVPIAANTEFILGFSHTTLQFLTLLSDQDVTIYVNATSGGSPIRNIPLKAGVIFIWKADGYSAVPFSADVTSFWITNASAAPASLIGEAIWN